MPLLRCFFVLILIRACAPALSAQIQDSAKAVPPSLKPATDSDLSTPEENEPNVADSLKSARQKDGLHRLLKKLKDEYPNPNTALFFSMVIPGGGQIYNRRWWKLPFVYAAYGGLVYAIRFNSNRYHRLRVAYIKALKNEPHEFTGTRLTTNDLKRLRDGFDRNRQLSYIGLFAVHLVQGAEAFVDCHLKTFDVSENLSMRIRPHFQMFPSEHLFFPAIGVVFYPNKIKKTTFSGPENGGT